jgi:hypothetical protein
LIVNNVKYCARRRNINQSVLSNFNLFLRKSYCSSSQVTKGLLRDRWMERILPSGNSEKLTSLERSTEKRELPAIMEG